MITPSQIRGARAMLELTQADLAAAAGISKTGLINIESGRSDPKASTLAAIQRALESAGVEFTNGGEPGVRLRAAVRTGFEGGPDPFLGGNSDRKVTIKPRKSRKRPSA